MTLCIYHGNCADGFGAAWAVNHWFRENRGEVEFFAGSYNKPAPDNVVGRDVILVDFSYKRPVLDEMVRKASTVLVLDHHKTAAEDLAGLPLPVGYGQIGPAPGDWGYCDVTSGYDREALFCCARENNGPPLYALFDMERSGAGIAWDFFFPRERRPKLINHIEDRDLGGGIARAPKLPETPALHAALMSYPMEFDVWDRFMFGVTGTDDTVIVEDLTREGEAILRKHWRDVESAIKNGQREMVIGGQRVPVCNAPPFLASDIGHAMAKEAPFAAVYIDGKDGRLFNLRSCDDGADVSEVAKSYGGGGHARAAGFRMPIGWEGD